MGRRKKKQKNNADIQVVLLFVVSIVLGILIYGKPGYIGQNIMPHLEYAIGWIEYLIPIAIFAAAVNVACEEGQKKNICKNSTIFSFSFCNSNNNNCINGNTGIVGRTITDYF